MPGFRTLATNRVSAVRSSSSAAVCTRIDSPGPGQKRVGNPCQVDRSRDYDADEVGKARKRRYIAIVEGSRSGRGDTEHSGRLAVTPKWHAPVTGHRETGGRDRA